MMNATLLRAVVLTLALLALAATGCGGRKGMATTPGYDRPDRGNYSPGGYYGDPYPPIDSYRDSYRSTDPLVSFPPNTSLAPRQVADVLSQQLAEFSGAFGGNFAELHQQLPYGLSSLNLPHYLFASANAELRSVATKGLPVWQVGLRSDVRTVSFVTYGLFDPHMAQRLTRVHLDGAGSFGTRAENGLYIGVRQFGEPRYYWYGPFTTGQDWTAEVRRDSNLGTGSAAYVTLAVFNGDELRIDGISVDLGS